MSDGLEWPAGWPRTKQDDRAWGNFNRRGPTNQYGYRPMRRITVTEAWNEITDEDRRLGGTDLRVDVDRKLNRDGSPSAAGRQGTDPGAVIHFRLQGRPLVIACDRFQHPESNLRAIAILLEAKRTLARYGFLDMVREFEGYAALPAGEPVQAPAPGQAAAREPTVRRDDPPPHEVLGIAPNAPATVAKAAYNALVLEHHPDRGGAPAEFRRIQNAWDLWRVQNS